MTSRTDPGDRWQVVRPSPAGLAASLTVVLWATAFVAIRSVGHHVGPGPVALVRQLTGTAVLGALALRRRRPLPRGRALGLVVAYGVAWFAAYNVVLNTAEHHLDPGTAALLVNVGPLIVAVVAGLALGEGLSVPLGAGLLLGFAGVVVIALGSGGRGSVSSAAGVGLGLAAAGLYATGVLLQKVALRSVDALSATWLGCAVGAVATLAWADQAWHQLRAAPTGDLLQLVYLGVGPTAVGFAAWAYALGRTPAGRMAATTLVVPAIAALAGWALLGEVPTAVGALGGVLCLAGVAMSRRPSLPRLRLRSWQPVSVDGAVRLARRPAPW